VLTRSSGSLVLSDHDFIRAAEIQGPRPNGVKEALNELAPASSAKPSTRW